MLLPEARHRAVPDRRSHAGRRAARSEPYGVDRLRSQGLLSLVQMGVLELHIWGSPRDGIEQPDCVVFDLDPDEGLAWERVVARRAAPCASGSTSSGLASFLKTTGGKGLHVVVPLARRAGWDEVKAFTKAVAEDIVAAEPGPLHLQAAQGQPQGQDLHRLPAQRPRRHLDLRLLHPRPRRARRSPRRSSGRSWRTRRCAATPTPSQNLRRAPREPPRPIPGRSSSKVRQSHHRGDEEGPGDGLGPDVSVPMENHMTTASDTLRMTVPSAGSAAAALRSPCCSPPAAAARREMPPEVPPAASRPRSRPRPSPPRCAEQKERAARLGGDAPLLRRSGSYQPAWIDARGPRPQAEELLAAIDAAGRRGARPAALRPRAPREPCSAEVEGDQVLDDPQAQRRLVDLDMHLTYTFLTLAPHLADRPAAARRPCASSWYTEPRNVDLDGCLAQALASDAGNRSRRRSDGSPPAGQDYGRLRDALARYRRHRRRRRLAPVPAGAGAEAGRSGARVAALRARLAAEGDLRGRRPAAGGAPAEAVFDDARRRRRRPLPAAARPRARRARWTTTPWRSSNVPAAERVRQIAGQHGALALDAERPRRALHPGQHARVRDGARRGRPRGLEHAGRGGQGSRAAPRCFSDRMTYLELEPGLEHPRRDRARGGDARRPRMPAISRLHRGGRARATMEVGPDAIAAVGQTLGVRQRARRPRQPARPGQVHVPQRATTSTCTTRRPTTCSPRGARLQPRLHPSGEAGGARGLPAARATRSGAPEALQAELGDAARTKTVSPAQAAAGPHPLLDRLGGGGRHRPVPQGRLRPRREARRRPAPEPPIALDLRAVRGEVKAAR